MNPFTTSYNPEHFCDREEEVKRLRANITNGLNTLIHSPRRLGKTGLIHHLFYKLEKSKKCETIFIDLFATSDMDGLIKNLSEKILDKYHKKNFFEGLKNILKRISTTVTLSKEGIPEISLQLSESNKVSTLNQLLDYLENRKKKVVVAFDEFQEVIGYPEKAEAILRSSIQNLSNVIFIFSGSTSHLLREMFFSAKRPFYQSAEVLALEKIDRKIYHQFIASAFAENSKQIDPEVVDLILDFTEHYTYYTQLISNQVFYQSKDVVSLDSVNHIIWEYLENRKTDYQNLLNLLPENQKKLAISVAKENFVDKPTAMDFIMKHKLPSISSVSQAVKTLVKKEVLYQNQNGYLVYDVFFKRFIQRYY